MSRWWSVLVASGLALTMVARAEDPMPPVPGEGKPARERGAWGFKAMDADGDGKVTLAEFKAGHAKMAEKNFAAMDKNGDGFLTDEDRPAPQGEAPAGRPAKVWGMARMTEMDTDGDGKVSLAEFKAAREKMAEKRFAAMDKNNDGALTPDELRGPGKGRRQGGPGSEPNKPEASSSPAQPADAGGPCCAGGRPAKASGCCE